MKEILINMLVGILGVVFVTISKMKSLQTDAEKANIEFNYQKYFHRELLSIILSFLSVIIWQLLFSEVAAKYHQLDGFIKCSFFLMGASGAWVIQKALGKTKGWIRGIVDVKTNIADGKTEGGKND